jgi:hypothetical protein
VTAATWSSATQSVMGQNRHDSHKKLCHRPIGVSEKFRINLARTGKGGDPELGAHSSDCRDMPYPIHHGRCAPATKNPSRARDHFGPLRGASRSSTDCLLSSAGASGADDPRLRPIGNLRSWAGRRARPGKVRHTKSSLARFPPENRWRLHPAMSEHRKLDQFVRVCEERGCFPRRRILSPIR